MTFSAEPQPALPGDSQGLCFTRLRIQTGTGESIDSILLDGDGQGLAVLVSSEHRPLRPDEGIGLHLQISGEEWYRTARVRSHARIDDIDRYRVEFERPIHADAQDLPATLDRIFFSGRAPCVHFPACEEVIGLAISELAGIRMQGRLANLSVDGACLELSASESECFSKLERLMLELRLPDDEQWLGLSARIQGRLQCSERGFLALAFETQPQARLCFTRERLGNFVSRRLGDAQRVA